MGTSGSGTIRKIAPRGLMILALAITAFCGTSSRNPATAQESPAVDVQVLPSQNGETPVQITIMPPEKPIRIDLPSAKPITVEPAPLSKSSLQAKPPAKPAPTDPVKSAPPQPKSTVKALAAAEKLLAETRFEEALAALQQEESAFAQGSLIEAYLDKKADCLMGLGRYEEAAAALNLLLQNNPGSALAPKALLCRGFCLELSGKGDDARQAYEAVLRKALSPDGQFRADLARERLASMAEPILP